ncbi:MAG: DUF4147 domain-containing protein [Firmicutes bacterium]|nr:DUF4147 domain-containing protein [Bacillota bacterium]
MRITNAETLTSHGNRRARKMAVDILEAGLQAADPCENTKRIIRLEGSRLFVGSAKSKPSGDPGPDQEVFDLEQIRGIYVFGAGKGVQYAAKALEDICGDLISGGHVIDKKGTEIILDRIEVTLGGHPLPDQDCLLGCRRILELTQKLSKDDLVFTLAANGISSLLTLPAAGISLEDVRRLTHIMQLQKGAPTADLNAIRNHVDQLKGGRFSRYLQPAKTVHLLVEHRKNYNDLLYKNLWLHTLPDFTTFADALEVVEKWQVRKLLPPAVIRHLEEGRPEQETLKAAEFKKMGARIFSLMPGRNVLLESARRAAEKLGLNSLVLAENLQAEASQAGFVIGEIANTIAEEGGLIPKPCALFTAGELLTTLGEETGVGGRNQEYAAAAALKIAGSTKIAVGAVDSDGTDGPGAILQDGTRFCLAGGVVDGQTWPRSQKLGVDLKEAIKRHNTSYALLKLGSGVEATPNISLDDLGVVVILD